MRRGVAGVLSAVARATLRPAESLAVQPTALGAALAQQARGQYYGAGPYDGGRPGAYSGGWGHGGGHMVGALRTFSVIKSVAKKHILINGDIYGTTADACCLGFPHSGTTVLCIRKDGQARATALHVLVTYSAPRTGAAEAQCARRTRPALRRWSS